jgi:hypothetical protein
VLLLSLLVSACSTESSEEWRRGPIPTCDTTSRGRLLLMAQSVPDASLIPCLTELPPGWEFSRAFSRSDESSLMFETDTFDLDVDVILLPSCEVAEARLVDSSRPETQLFISADGIAYSFVFDGGCIRFEYETRQLAESREGRALMDAIPFMTRDTLRELSGWTL